MSQVKEIQLAAWKFRCESCNITYVTPPFQIVKDDTGQISGKATCSQCKRELLAGELIRNE